MSLLPASLAVTIAVSFATPQVGTDDVRITEVSADPPFVSGFYATAVGVAGTHAGERRFYLIPFMTIDQTKPQVGERCDIRWQWHSGFDWLIGDGRSVHEGRMVTKFHCDPELH